MTELQTRHPLRRSLLPGIGIARERGCWGLVVAVSKGQWIYVAHDRNINPAPARNPQRDRQNILLRDVAIARTMSRSATAGRARPRGQAASRRRADYRQGRDSVWNGTSRHVRPDEQAVCAQSRAFVTRSVQVSRVLIARCDLAQCDLARPGVSAEHLRVSCALPLLPGSLRCWPLKCCSPAWDHAN